MRREAYMMSRYPLCWGALVLGQYPSRYACKPTRRFLFGLVEHEQCVVVLLLAYRKSHNMFVSKAVN